MRNFLSITVALVAVAISFHTVTANCGKTSAFRYEFESWVRRYIFAVIEHTSRDIEKIYTITLSELELDDYNQFMFQQKLNEWHEFTVKVTTPKADFEGIIEEFRAKSLDFDERRAILESLATKNMANALEKLDDMPELLSKEYANELIADWRHFGTMHDFETLGQREDCKRINKIMENLRKDEIKRRAVVIMSRALFEIFGMHDWMMLLSAQENSAEVDGAWRKSW